jgi:hypothetical protein
MNLLQFSMPPSARTVWASAVARKEWEPKIQRAASAYYQLERLTVREGLRECTTFHASPDRIESEVRALAKQGLCYLPMRKVGNYSGFAHSHPPVIQGKPWSFYGVIGRNAQSLEAFADASDKGDHMAIGKLLGYPECCASFFSKVWTAGYVDPIFQAATVNGHPTEAVWESSLIWPGYRYIGVRLSPHLPCSCNCAESIKMAERWLSIGHGLPIPDLLEVLSLPCEWDCLKGVAQITTPYFRIVTNSIPCYPRHIVRKS